MNSKFKSWFWLIRIPCCFCALTRVLDEDISLFWGCQILMPAVAAAAAVNHGVRIEFYEVFVYHVQKSTNR